MNVKKQRKFYLICPDLTQDSRRSTYKIKEVSLTCWKNKKGFNSLSNCRKLFSNTVPCLNMYWFSWIETIKIQNPSWKWTDLNPKLCLLHQKSKTDNWAGPAGSVQTIKNERDYINRNDLSLISQPFWKSVIHAFMK